MPHFAANLTLMFNEVPFLDRFAAAASAGFKGVEILFPYEHPAEELASRLKDNGLTQALFNLPPGDFSKGDRGLAALPGREADFEAALETALAYAGPMNCKCLHAMAGLTSSGAERATYVANLKKAAASAAPHGIDILIEPINTRDVPGYFLNHLGDARKIIEEVGASNLKLQLDIYHRQIVAGDLAKAIEDYADITRHMQIANPPDRGEPDAGEINYTSVFQMIDASGFEGWVGCEYHPRGDTVSGLAWVERCGTKLG